MLRKKVGRTKTVGTEVGRTKTVRNTEKHWVTHCYSLISLSRGPEVNHHTTSLKIKLSYKTSFLNHDGDFESNPWSNIPFKVITFIGAFYWTVLLKFKIYEQCHCKAYRDLVDIQELGFDVSFLKVLQLFVDDDIDSNLGPTSGMSKGRKARKRTFNITPQNSDANRVQEMIVDANILRTSNPLGLKNVGQNVYFFNSVIQVWYSVDSFCAHKCLLNSHDQVVLIIKELFKQIECSNHPIETYQYFQSWELPNYDPISRQQLGAKECLMYILNQVYPLKSDNSVPDENVFQTSSIESVLCQNCNHALEKTL